MSSDDANELIQDMMGRTPRKPESMDMYNRIHNLLDTDVKRDMDRLRAELEQTKRELQRNAAQMQLNAKKTMSQFAPIPSPPSDRTTSGGGSLYDAYFSAPTTKQKQTKGSAKPTVVDKTTTNNDITQYTPETHKVRVSTKVTSQDRENGTRKIIGMETVEWWEYVLIYGFFKATKIAYEYNIVKDMIKNPYHIVSLINKGALVLTFTPVNNVKETKDRFEGKDVLVRTGTRYREFQLPIEIPYKTGTRTEEVKKGFFLYEETFVTIEPDYEALGKKIAQELEEKKMNEGFKLIIAKEIENGRISRV